jgi:hypothetical protein
VNSQATDAPPQSARPQDGHTFAAKCAQATPCGAAASQWEGGTARKRRQMRRERAGLPVAARQVFTHLSLLLHGHVLDELLYGDLALLLLQVPVQIVAQVFIQHHLDMLQNAIALRSHLSPEKQAGTLYDTPVGC